jgi:hypothetical protein
MFNLSDNSQQNKICENGFDALFKIWPLLQKLTHKFQQTYYPEETAAEAVDEEMCLFKGRVNFRAYMPTIMA